MRAMAQVHAFIAEHGSSRFEKLNVIAGTDEETPDDRIISHRAGWKRLKDGMWEYLIPPGIWKREVCAGLDPGHIATVLMARGLLRGATTKHKADSVRITGYSQRMRVYRVSAAILEDETDGK
jgi:putative DNA primase/helicase